MGNSTNDGEQLCKFILKSIQSCRTYGPDKSLTLKCDLDIGSTSTNLSNGTSAHDGESLCQIILESIPNCRSNGSDKFKRTDEHVLRHTHGWTDTGTYTELLL